MQTAPWSGAVNEHSPGPAPPATSGRRVAGCLLAGLVVYLALVGYALPRTVADRGELLLFALLLCCGAVCAEAAHRLATPAPQPRSLVAVWCLPAILLLPPLYALLAPLPLAALALLRTQSVWSTRRNRRLRSARRHRTAVRPLLDAVAAGVAGYVAATAFGVVLHSHGHSALEWPVPRAELLLASGWSIAIALLCATLFTVVNAAIRTVVEEHLSAGVPVAEDPPWDRERMLLGGAELCVGVTVAILCSLSVWLLAVALPPVLLLQRGLFFQQLRTAARTDGKTGLLNSDAWQRAAEGTLSHAAATGAPVALLLLDIDHFKRVNDRHGHLCGDHVLAGVAAHLRRLLDGCVVGRFGGEEFVALLPDADEGEALRVAERIRAEVRSLSIPRPVLPVGGPGVAGVPGTRVLAARPGDTVAAAGGRVVGGGAGGGSVGAVSAAGAGSGGGAVTVTVSVGVAVLWRHGRDLTELVASADHALYRAKGAGRDRVCLPAR